MFNKVILIGNLTRDVELRYTDGGTAKSTFGLAVNKKIKDRNSGQVKEKVLFIDVVIWGRSAEIANQHLGKGRRVLIEGELSFDQWQDQNGNKRSKHHVDATAFQFLDSRSGGESNYSHYDQQNNQARSDSPFGMNDSQSDQSGNPQSNVSPDLDIDDDDIPF